MALKKEDIDHGPAVRIPDALLIEAEASVISSGGDPRELQPVEVDDKTATFPPVLLNPGQKLRITVLVSGGKDDPVVSLEAADFRIRRLSGAPNGIAGW